MAEGFEVFDERFDELLLPESRLEHLAGGCIWAEGPVWLPDDSVVWSDIPNDRMLRWSAARGVETFRQPSNYSNGNTLDREGRLVTCEHGARRVSRTEADGSVVTLADRFQGGRFNSPNDVVVRPDDSIWFTDPPYGILPGTEEGHENPFEQDGCHVYRLDPASGAIARVIHDMVKPNGLAFSPDGARLYVADTGASHDPDGPHHIRVFDVVDGVSLGEGRLFAEINPGLPDGFRFDQNGYLFTSSADSIQVYTQDGERLGKILAPEPIANCCFGGSQFDHLYITATTSLYVIRLNTLGVRHA